MKFRYCTKWIYNFSEDAFQKDRRTNKKSRKLENMSVYYDLLNTYVKHIAEKFLSSYPLFVTYSNSYRHYPKADLLLGKSWNISLLMSIKMKREVYISQSISCFCCIKFSNNVNIEAKCNIGSCKKYGFIKVWYQ